MRADQYVKLGAPPLQEQGIELRGIGAGSGRTLSKFCENIVVDDESYGIDIHVVSDDLMRHDLLVGADLLNTVNVNIKEGKIFISKSANYNVTDPSLPEIFQINCIQEVHKVDISYVEDGEIRRVLTSMINDYKTVEVRDVVVRVKLILRDDKPVFLRLRRLSSLEKEIVNRKIDEWLLDGIIQP